MQFVQRHKSFISPKTVIDSLFIHFPVRRHTLSNGLKILTMENHLLPVVSMYTLYKVGSRDERPGITGISHLFEHMMFNGSRKFGPKEFDRILESGGGRSNAYTSRDLTVYYEDFTPSLLEKVIELDSDRMGWLNLSPGILRSEREVVKEERRLRTDNSVYGRLDEELYAASYQSHPYRWPIIGWMPDIENIRLSDCKKYHKSYYAPNNAILVLSGAFHTDKTLKLLEKYYGQVPSGKLPAEPTTAESSQNGEKRLKFRKKAELHNFIAGYHVPAIGHKDVYALDVLQTILTDGESSILHRSLVRKQEIVHYLRCDFTWHLNPGLFEFYVQLKPGITSRKGELQLEKELNTIKKESVHFSDLERAKNILEADFIFGFQTNNGRAHRIGTTEILFGDFRKITDSVLEYRKVTADDIKRVARHYFTPENRTVVWLDIK